MVDTACVPSSVLPAPQEEPASNRAAAEKTAAVLVLLFITSFLSRKIRIISEISIVELLQDGIELLKKNQSDSLYEHKISSYDYDHIVSRDLFENIVSSGEYTHICISGDLSKIVSSGQYTRISSSGDFDYIVSSGKGAKIISSGKGAKIVSCGDNSVICCAGNNSIVKAKKGSWITLSELEFSDEKNRNVPKCVKTEYVDGERIKEDTWYRLVNGEFKEVK